MLDYKWFLARVLLVGSGMAEGGIRFVGKDRLDCTGMKWTEPGAEDILTLRALGVGQAVCLDIGKGYALTRPGRPAQGIHSADSTRHLYRDALARVVKKEDPLGRRWTFEFDERDRLVSSTVPAVTAQFRQEYQGQRSLYNCYDRNDLLLSSSDLDGRQTHYGYDKAHRLIAVQEAGYPKPIRLKYDVMDKEA